MKLNGTILVTGGAGFIGSALIHALNQRGLDDILVTDILGTDEKWRNLVGLRYSDYIEADTFRDQLITSPDRFRNVKTVFHLGACSATTETDASYLIRNNFEYTKLLAQWCINSNVRFVYASSAATYGDGSAGMDDQTDDLVKYRPLNMYGYSKHMFDLYPQQRGWLKQIVGLKYFNVFGPNEYHKGTMRSLVAKAYTQIVSTGKLQLFKSHHPDYKDGEQMRDFLYVKDAVAMSIHLAETETANGLFNLGSGEANTWVTLAQAIFSSLNKEAQIEFIDMPMEIRPNYQYYTKADIGKLRAKGYTSPVTPLPDAIRDYVTNYLVNGARLAQVGS